MGAASGPEAVRWFANETALDAARRFAAVHGVATAPECDVACAVGRLEAVMLRDADRRPSVTANNCETYTECMSAGDNRQHAKFHKYMAAPLEAKWAALVDEVDPRGCKDWMPGGRLVTEATQDIKTGLWNSSFSHFKYLAKDGRTMLYPIEPLFSSLRHPYLLTSTDNSTRATALKTSYA
jgi:hypothetical protein